MRETLRSFGKNTKSIDLKCQITIIGANDVGIYLAENLGRANQNVVLIEREEEFLRELNEEVDVFSLQGNPLGVQTLKEAGVGEGTKLIAVTNSDELNLLLLFLGECLNIKEGFALVKEQEHYQSFLPRIVRSSGRLNMVNYWELVTQEIEQRVGLKFRLLYSDPKRKIILVGVEFLACHPFLSQPISELKVGNHSRILQILRKGQWLTLVGSLCLEAGDILVLSIDLAEHDRVMRHWFTYENWEKVMIGGDGLIQALKSHWPNFFKGLVCIEKRLTKCQKYLKIIDHSLILHGDALDISLLKEAGIEKTGLFLSASENDEINLLSSLIAKSFGVKEVLTILHKRQHFGMLEHLNLDGIISIPQLIVEYFLSRLSHRKGSTNLDKLTIEITPSPTAKSLKLTFKAGNLLIVDDTHVKMGENEILSINPQ